MDRTDAAIEKHKKRALAKKSTEKRKSDFAKCATEVFSTSEGKRVLLWLMEECQYQVSNISCLNAKGELSAQNMIWNESRRDLYIRLRSLLKTRPDILEAVEIRKLEGELNG